MCYRKDMPLSSRYYLIDAGPRRERRGCAVGGNCEGNCLSPLQPLSLRPRVMSSNHWSHCNCLTAYGAQ